MKEFTKEMLQTLIEADCNEYNERKTKYYARRYHMTCDRKIGNSWKFHSNYDLPKSTGIIKTFKGQTYIIVETPDDFVKRYHVNAHVKELLNI